VSTILSYSLLTRLGIAYINNQEGSWIRRILKYFWVSNIKLVMLQTQDLRVDQEKEPCIRVNTRELDGELCTR